MNRGDWGHLRSYNEVLSLKRQPFRYFSNMLLKFERREVRRLGEIAVKVQIRIDDMWVCVERIEGWDSVE